MLNAVPRAPDLPMGEYPAFSSSFVARCGFVCSFVARHVSKGCWNCDHDRAAKRTLRGSVQDGQPVNIKDKQYQITTVEVKINPVRK